MESKKYKVTCEGKEIEVSEDVYKISYSSVESEKRTDRRKKTGRIIVDEHNETVTFVPCVEDSLDRLLETGLEIEDPSQNPELTDTQIMVKDALTILTKKERYIIFELYYGRRTERELAAEFGISQKNFNKRKQRILNKMHNFLEKQ